MWAIPPIKYQFLERKPLPKRGNREEIASKVRRNRGRIQKRSRRAENTGN
jgi:hypothetical protein